VIVPGSIPVIEGDMEALGAHARSISETGRAFADTGAAVHTTWQGLYPHYVAPESGQLLSATGPVATVSATVGEDLGSAGTALATYAAEVTLIQAEFVALRRQADELVTTITALGDGWNSDQALVDRDKQLIGAVTEQIVAFQEAERRCASALRALYGAPPLTADNGDGVLDPATEHGYTLDQLGAAAANGGLPWGTTTEVDHPWYIDVVNVPISFVTGLKDSVVGAVVGVGALVGLDDTGWHGSTAGQAWGNLGNLGLGLLVYGVFGIAEAERIDNDGSIPWLAPGTLGQTLEAAGKGFIAYDQWDDDPARAAGATLGNVVLAVVGTKGAGAGLRGSGAAVGRIPGPVAAQASRALLATGNAIGRIPTLADIARGATNAFQGFRTRLFGDADGPPIPGAPDSGGRTPDPLNGTDPPSISSLDGHPPHDRDGSPSTATADNEPIGVGAVADEPSLPHTAHEVPDSATPHPPADGEPTGSNLDVRSDQSPTPPVIEREVPLPTRDLDSHYLTETDPDSPTNPFAPQAVHYFTPEELEASRLYVEDGLLVSAATGLPADTSAATTVWSGQGRAIFVMDESGNVYATMEQSVGHIHHTSITPASSLEGQS
jgi:hypothetical protein